MRTFALTIPRDGAVVARWAHNPKVVSSSLAPATKKELSNSLIPFLFLRFIAPIPQARNASTPCYDCHPHCLTPRIKEIIKPICYNKKISQISLSTGL